MSIACLQTVSRDMRAACNTELVAYNPNRMAVRELTKVRQVPDTDPLCYLAQAIAACCHTSVSDFRHVCNPAFGLGMINSLLDRSVWALFGQGNNSSRNGIQIDVSAHRKQRQSSSAELLRGPTTGQLVRHRSGARSANGYP